MAYRPGYAWLLLPLLAVLGAFLYAGGMFGRFFWGYLGLMHLWVLLFTLGFGIVVALFPAQQKSAPESVIPEGVFWDSVLLLLGALAISALFYDRYFLRGIDYLSVGVAKGRALLNQGGHESSVFSVLGNFFLYSYLFPLIRAIIMWEERSSLVRLAIIATALLELVAVTYVMGGRTAILLTIVVCLGSVVVRSFLGKRHKPASLNYSKLLVLGAVSLVAFSVFFLFRSRAFGDGSSLSYYTNICGHLTSGTLLECDFGVYSGPWSDLANYLHLTLLYGSHGTWLTEDIVQSGISAGWITPQGLFAVFFERLGMEPPAVAFEGFWVPASASLVNDFGLAGMLSFATAFGILTGVTVGYLRKGRINFAAYALVFAISFWFLSFLIFPTNIPGFVLAVCLGVFLWGTQLLLTTMKALISERYP
ncbi:hypothetical protein [Marinobacter sp.]|uniref:hypothetical protein n=1 Tax=Marinobacter sp. TaxID=50741 RepID=UPI003A8ED500